MCLEDLMFVPLSNPYRKVNIGNDGLDPMIALLDDSRWKPVDRYQQALEYDYVFHKIGDFMAYYLMPSEIAQSLDEAHFFSWDLFLATLPINEQENPYYDFSKHKLNSGIKTKLYDDYHNDGSLYSAFPVRFPIDTLVGFITVYGFLPIILVGCDTSGVLV